MLCGDFSCRLRMEVQEVVGRYLSEMRNAELTGFLERASYERKGGSARLPERLLWSSLL